MMKSFVAIIMFGAALLTCPAQSWTNVYRVLRVGTGTKGLGVDSAGNVFVTGSSATNASGTANYDYTTIKYSSAGVPQWTNFYDGPANGPDYANALAVGGDGTVFVTGSSWNGFNNDYLTIGYSSSGATMWTNRYNGSANRNDFASAVVVDTNGNVFVTGGSEVAANNFDVATIKYSSAGVPLWTNRYHGSGNGQNDGKAMALDNLGNVFVTGRTTTSDSFGTHLDFVTIGYSNNGVALWTNRYGVSNNSVDEATAIAVSGGGDVIVTGEAGGFPGLADYATLKYSGAGMPLWTNRYNGPGDDYDGARDVAVDATGNVYVTGESIGSDFYSDFATIKYSDAGIPQWTNRYNGPATDYDFGQSLAIDASGNVFVTGVSWASDFFSDCATVAYSGAGTMLWDKLYSGGMDSDDGGYALVVDASGNVIVGGITSPAGDFLTIKYAVETGDLFPWLSIEQQPGAVVLSWTNAAFGLQSAPGVAGTFTNIVGATSPYTNPVSGSQQYFRLHSN